MQKLRYVLVLILFLFFNTYSNAKEKNILLTGQIIKSMQKCNTKQSVQLRCKSYQQTTPYTCGPAVIMSLMNYYGLMNASSMNQQTELRIAHEMGGTSEGTSSTQLAGWLRNHGFQVESGRNITTDMIIANIDRKVPIIVEVSDHWILAKGYHKGATPDEDEIIFADSCCSVTLMSRKTIDTMDHGGRCNGDVGAYIIATK